MYIYIYIASLNSNHIAKAYVVTFSCLKAEILRHLVRFICTFLTKEACCRNIEIVLYPTTLSYIKCAVV